MHLDSGKKVNLTAYRTDISRFRVINWIARRRWWVIGLASLLILSFVIFDSMHRPTSYIYGIEFFIFLTPLLIIGLLLDILLREIRIQVETAKILEYKHKLSTEFSGYNDWNVLVTQLARFPTTVAEVDQTCLFVWDALSRQFTHAARWSSVGKDEIDLCSAGICEKCIANKAGTDLRFSQCESKSAAGEMNSQAQRFCLPIRYGESLLGILQFRLAAGKPLSGEQDDIFRNIGDEIGIALKVGQDRKSFFEMRSTETALAERRSVSDYLHDHLGQNLGYLHFKIDQLLSEKDRPSLEKVFHELEHMRNAANDSYEILRGVLETIHPETTPMLTNLLLEHARKVSQRANIKMDFKVKGNPIFLPVEVQRAIFYAFEESLSNVEKHSRASKVDVLAEWGQDYFALSISDNGVGFNPQVVDTDQHFGLEILNERMAKVSGRITLTTTENYGTIVNIHVPSSSGGNLRDAV
jgi:nitrate/nitrite-specific signal transduction histidine kinase